ncbi:MAG: hypothetical protein IJQ37_00735 [Clostridia bacterium]|nr:hypothetical protein [Clostridia bacterium]
MKKTTKILTVVLAAAILFSVLSVSAFARDDIRYTQTAHKYVLFNNDIFDCKSEMVVYTDGSLYVGLNVSFFDQELFEDEFPYEENPYPDYVPTGESYSINLSVMTVFQIYSEQMTTEWTYGSGTLSSVHPVLASNIHQLQSNVPYQYVSTENFIVITSSTGATYEVLSNGIAQFWT